MLQAKSFRSWWMMGARRQLMVGTQYDLMPVVCLGGSRIFITVYSTYNTSINNNKIEDGECCTKCRTVSLCNSM